MLQYKKRTSKSTSEAQFIKFQSCFSSLGWRNNTWRHPTSTQKYPVKKHSPFLTHFFNLPYNFLTDRIYDETKSVRGRVLKLIHTGALRNAIFNKYGGKLLWRHEVSCSGCANGLYRKGSLWSKKWVRNYSSGHGCWGYVTTPMAVIGPCLANA